MAPKNIIAARLFTGRKVSDDESGRKDCGLELRLETPLLHANSPWGTTGKSKRFQTALAAIAFGKTIFTVPVSETRRRVGV